MTDPPLSIPPISLWFTIPVGLGIRYALRPNVLRFSVWATVAEFKPLFVSVRHDPEALKEGIFLLRHGINPYHGIGASTHECSAGALRSAPLLLLFAAPGSDGAVFEPHLLWLFAALLDVFCVLLLYALIQEHWGQDELRRRARKSALWLRDEDNERSDTGHDSRERIRNANETQLIHRSHEETTLTVHSNDPLELRPENLPGMACVVYFLHPFALCAGACGSFEAGANTLPALSSAYCALKAAASSSRAREKGQAQRRGAELRAANWFAALSGVSLGVGLYLDPFAAACLAPALILAATRVAAPPLLLPTQVSDGVAPSSGTAAAPPEPPRRQPHQQQGQRQQRQRQGPQQEQQQQRQQQQLEQRWEPGSHSRQRTAALAATWLIGAALGSGLLALLSAATLAFLLDDEDDDDGGFREPRGSVLGSTTLKLDWSWVGPAYGSLLGGGGDPTRPELGLGWHLAAVGFRLFRYYFRWLHVSLLPLALVPPLLFRLGTLPSPFASSAAAQTTKNPRGGGGGGGGGSGSGGGRPSEKGGLEDPTFLESKSSGGSDHSTTTTTITTTRSSTGALVVFSVVSSLSAILHPHPTLRSHAAALGTLLLHPDLLLGYFDSAVNDSEVAAAELAAHERRGLLVTPFPWSWSLRAVCCCGHALTTTGVLVMWRMWCGQDHGKGNANYLYFQALAFHVFQALLVCGVVSSAVRREQRTLLGEARAQRALCCAVRRWLLERRRRERRRIDSGSGPEER